MDVKIEQKTCTKCGIMKDTSDFYRRSKPTERFTSWCKKWGL